MWGALQGVLQRTVSRAVLASELSSAIVARCPFWPTLLDFGRMTACRCANVHAGGLDWIACVQGGEAYMICLRLGLEQTRTVQAEPLASGFEQIPPPFLQIFIQKG